MSTIETSYDFGLVISSFKRCETEAGTFLVGEGIPYRFISAFMESAHLRESMGTGIKLVLYKIKTNITSEIVKSNFVCVSFYFVYIKLNLFSNKAESWGYNDPRSAQSISPASLPP